MFIQKLKSQKYFFHLLITITSFFIAATMLLSGTLYSGFRTFGENIINQSSQELLSGIANNASFIDKYAYNYSSALFNNPTITQLMFDSNVDIYDTLSNIQQIQNYLQSAPFVYSIYIYNAKEERYYIIGPHTDILSQADMYDQEITGILQSSTALPASPFARMVPVSRLNQDATENLYTYWVSQLNMKQQLTGSVVLNVRTNWIFETLLASSKDKIKRNSHILMVNPEGQIMGDSDNKLFLSDLSGEPYIKQVLSSPDASGYFVEQVNGSKSVVVYSNLEQPNWRIINIIPYQYLSRSIDKIGSITLTVSLLVFGAGLLISYLLSRRLYSPIRILQQRVGELLGTGSVTTATVNEFQDIESHVSQAVDHLMALKQFKNSNINRLKSDFLNSLLAGKASVEQRLDELNLRIADKGHYMIVLIKLDNYAAFISNRSSMEQASLRFALMNIAGELLSARFQCESIDSGEDFCIMILDTPIDIYSQEHEAEQELDLLLAEVQKVYHSYYHITVSCFKTETCGSLSQLHELYHKARQYGMERLRYGHGCLLSYLELQEPAPEAFDISDPLVEDFLNKMKGLKREEITESLNQIMKRLYRCDYNTSMCLLSHILSSSFNYLNSLDKNRTVKFNLSFLAYHKTITSMETLEEIRGLILGLFEGVFLQLENFKDDHYSLIAESALAYLHENYRDKNLSQQLLANKLKVSPVMLGKIFRETTNSSVADYLKELRLVRAKEYLRDTHYSIDEIVEEIGWGNTKYFYTAFKQTYAVTPMEYRLSTSLERDKEGKRE
ncbi:MAG: hypothetical protein K0R57_6339 [Paenibacillaceae bacterium]|jgi:AraC-like DNA-binding protein|nr:hypothetical protein [Paenibacillaceae bacterium]